jgi:hypothetical protein
LARKSAAGSRCGLWRVGWCWTVDSVRRCNIIALLSMLELMSVSADDAAEPATNSAVLRLLILLPVSSVSNFLKNVQKGYPFNPAKM